MAGWCRSVRPRCSTGSVSPEQLKLQERQLARGRLVSKWRWSEQASMELLLTDPRRMVETWAGPCQSREHSLVD